MSKRKLSTIELVGFEDDEFELPSESFSRWLESPIRNLLAPDGQKQINIFGEIGRDFFTGGGITAAWVRDQLEGAQDVTVNIDSPGGSFHQGNSIYSLLAQHKGKVTVNVLGNAASAASLIAMAGDEIFMVKNGAMFIHNAHGSADGDHRTMADVGATLGQIDSQIRTIYGGRTGLKDAELKKMMDGAVDGTWMVAQVAIEKGFADAILPESDVKNMGPRAELDISPTLARRALEAASAGKIKLTRRVHNRYFEIAAKLEARPRTATHDAGLKALADEIRGIVPTSWGK